MALFHTENVSKRYSGHTALDRVSIEVPEQSIFGLLGPNGAGKTSLIRIINLITGPDEGKLWFRGEQLQQKHIHNIGYLPEERGLYRKMKVGEHALYLARLKGLSKREAYKKLKEWFDKFEIGGWWNKKVEELSKGMQQKLQFIVTVLHDPELLIFDEPFSGFDPINVELLKDEILRMRDNGTTIIFSTHNMASVEELCDHIALIDRSKKILDGKVQDIKKQYRSNTYHITFDHDNGPLSSHLDGRFEIIEQGEEEDRHMARIRIAEGHHAKDLLQILVPKFNIQSFNEILPTMNDIFISVVKENEGK
ncbi:MAG: ATP-binding cassette domain-containing protein [Bacteroidales bacterium]|jgi:ABC-2 type transport system ATP-binding protein|nr:ATP-binding cassette domain-containing protein [Bacteroidales bacterium]